MLHELYGAGPTLFRFAHRIADAGFEAYVPILFGTPNGSLTPKAIFTAARVCLSKEFAAFATQQSAPVADWVRLLGREINGRSKHPGIGVVGLCLTGNFALTLACDDWVAASVASEPALPFGFTPSSRRDLHLSPAETAQLKHRTDSGFEIMAFRFVNDPFSPAERDENLRATFAPVLGNGSLKPTCLGAHAVFTDHFDETPASSTAAAFQMLLAYLRGKLYRNAAAE